MSGQDYIGCKISLISLSDIRYVGTLHSINTSDSTVSLEKVRSFGTEGRRGNPEDEVMASDTVFDFVVFRGSDIKDLQVFEAPMKHTAPTPMVEPTLHHSMENYPPAPMNPYMMQHYPPQAQHQAMYWQSQMYPGQHQQPPPPPQMQLPPPSQQMPTASPMPVPPATTTSSTTIHQQTPIPASKMSPEAQKQQQQQSEHHVDQQEIDGATVESLAKKVSELDVDVKELTTEKTALSTTTTTGTPSLHQRHNNHMNPRQQRHTGNNNNNVNGQSHHRNKQRLDVPQSDFDFESSNAKFSKTDLLKELVKGSGEDGANDNEFDYGLHYQQKQEEHIVIPPIDEDFYDKTRSFFDNISCESKERQNQDGNIDRRGKFQERKLNMETFGQASVDQSTIRNFRGRGGYRGGYRGHRGGGYYRGGGNRNYNNRNNYYGYKAQQQQQVEPQ